MSDIDNSELFIKPSAFTQRLEDLDFIRRNLGLGDVTTSPRYNMLERVRHWASGVSEGWDVFAHANAGINVIQGNINLSNDDKKQESDRFDYLYRSLDSVMRDIAKSDKGDFKYANHQYTLYNPSSNETTTINGQDHTAFEIAEALAKKIVDFLEFYKMLP
jgi:hypothetical protein